MRERDVANCPFDLLFNKMGSAPIPPGSLVPHDTSWKEDILQKLQRRNQSETECFRLIFEAYGKLFDFSDSLKSQNMQLNLLVEKLREDDSRGPGRTGDPSTPGDARNAEKAAVLEQKVYKLQEELTEMHRRKGENAQQLIDLRNQMQDKEKLIMERERKIQDQEAMIYTIKQALKQSEAAVLDLERSNQCLKDEQQALHIAYCSMEEKFRKLAMENQELIDRWLKHKAAEVDKMNQETEHQSRLRQRSMQKEILEAAKDPVAVNVDFAGRDDFYVPPVCCVIIPSTAQKKFDAHDGEVNAIRWSPSGRYFATGGADRKVKLWETGATGPECRGVLTGSNAAVMSVDFDPGETLVVGASSDFAARVWTINDQRLRHTLTGHSGKVFACKFFSGSNRVVSGSHDRTLKLWDLRSRACVQTIFAGSSCNDLVTFGSQSIISGHFDKKIRFWDTRTEQSVNELLLFGRITSLDISPDCLYYMACSRDDTLKIIDIRTNQVTVTLCAEGFKVGIDWLRAVFSPDGQYAMAGSNDGVLYVWNLKTGQHDNVEKMLKEHSTTITACSWHPQGAQLLSCDRNKKVVLWSDM